MFKSMKKVLALSAAAGLLGGAEADKVFKSSSLSTCMKDSSFAANLFYVTYTPNNGQITFNINGFSRETSKVLLDIELLGYGYSVAHPITDPCNTKELAGLCPLNSGQIEINSSLPAPADAVKKIPTPIYYIPDIDVKVRLWINSTETGKALACVEADLGNEKTVHQKGVALTIALIVLLSLVLSAISSGLGHSNTAAHLASNVLSLFGYFQAQGFIGMTAVKTPPIVRAWTQNFQWSMGIIRVDFLQTIATWYQRATGGKPSTNVSTLATTSVLVQKRALFERTNDGSSNRQAMKFLTVKGIERVGFIEDIEATNIFFTSFMFFILFVLSTTISVFLFKHACVLLIRMKKMRPERFLEFRAGWTIMLKGILFRIVLITFPQMAVMCFWEMTRRDSPAEVILAILSILTMLILLTLASIKVWKHANRFIKLYYSPAYALFSDARFLNKWGFLYIQFKASVYLFFVPVLLYTLTKSLFVALGQEKGVLQAVALVVLELAFLLAVSIVQPYMDKQTNRLNVSIAAVNFVNALLLLFFAGAFTLPGLAIGIMGVLFFVLNASFALIIILFVIWTSVSAAFSKNPDTKYEPMQDDRGSFIKSVNNLQTELDALGATARGESKTRIPIEEKEAPLGWNTGQDFRGHTNHFGRNEAQRRGFGMSQESLSNATANASLRDSHSRLLPMHSHNPPGPLPSGGFAAPMRAESPLSKVQSTSNWQKGVGY